ncbi:hypothetical protein DV737_g347, partial [Chaetothyriales sp. CBS 132003]
MAADRPRRNFNPAKTPRYGRPSPFSPDKLVRYSPKWQYSRLMNFPFCGSCFRPRMYSVVVAVDAASRTNHDSTVANRSAYGVYFGPHCRFNESGMLTSSELKSSGAELEAVWRGLEAVLARRRAGELEGFREIVIMLDSAYAANVFRQWVWLWEARGWTRANGQPIKNQAEIQRTHNIIRCMEANNMAVRFWRVDRKWNEAAAALANAALDEAADALANAADALANAADALANATLDEAADALANVALDGAALDGASHSGHHDNGTYYDQGF